MLAFLVAWFGARDCYGQYFQNRLAKRQRITSAPYSFRYFFPHKYGLSRGWYRSKKDYWKLHNKVKLSIYLSIYQLPGGKYQNFLVFYVYLQVANALKLFSIITKKDPI